MKQILFLAALSAVSTSCMAGISLAPISTAAPGLATDIFRGSAAEIVQYDPVSQRVFVVNAMDDAIDVIDISDPSNPVFLPSIDVSAWGSPNSVAVNPRPSRDEIAVAVENGSSRQANGFVLFFDTDGQFLGQATAGALPDMVTYDHTGKLVLVANEGEPDSSYSNDPEGSVTLIDVQQGPAKAVAHQVSFTSLNGTSPAGVRLTGPAGTTVAQDLEPEYIAVAPDNQTAYVTLQENNAIAVIDLKRRMLAGIFGLGYKDHSLAGNGLDASNRDGGVNIANWPVRGLFMPDTIAAYEAAGAFYLVTANEGDSRDYPDYGDEGYLDESRVKDVDLDETAFPNASDLQKNGQLGRLKMINTEGDTDGDGDYDEIYSFGARSFSIWSTAGELVFDSGDQIEQKLNELFPDDFNSNHDEGPSFDSRSDDKGPEPEGLVIGKVKGRNYAFVGLERMSGIMVFDITDPHAVSFVAYAANRDFSAEYDEDNTANVAQAGDLGPEGLAFIPAHGSPTKRPLLVVGNEVSGTTTIYEITTH